MSIKKIKQKTMSIQMQLTLWLSFFLIFTGIILVSINYFAFSKSIKTNLSKKTLLTCKKLSVVLNEAAWNLDNEQMKQYFKNYPWELSGISSVTVFTEFNDPIYKVNFKKTTDTQKCRQPIHYNDDVVGFIEVAMDKTRQTAVGTMIVRFWSSSMIFGIIAILAVALILMKKLIGDPIKLLMSGLKEIESGNIDFRFPEVRNSREALMISKTVDAMSVEIGKRSRQLKRENQIRKATEDKLKEFTDNLEDQVQERTRSLQKAYKALQVESKERRQLQNEILSISDRERQRIGSDLHDSLGQQLTGVSLLLSILTKTLQKKGIPEIEVAASLETQMKTVIKEARALSHGLAPLRLDDDGLVSTLQSFATDTESITGIICKFKCDEDINTFDEMVAMHIYRITQEAVNNAQKHGKADVINITMSKHPEYETMGKISIEDNGCGIDDSKISSDGIGLRIMNFRAESIGGAINIKNNSLGGTTVSFTYINSHNNN